MSKKWNLLFIFPDQQRYDTLAAYGNTKIKMPNLNRLAEQSVVFKRAYVTQPVCTPSRATIMTGLYPHHHGCENNNKKLEADIHTLPELLGDKEYRSAYIGKWHLGYETTCQHGFDEWISTEDNYRVHQDDPSKGDKSSYHHFLKKNGFMPDLADKESPSFSRVFATRLPERFSKPAFIAEETSRFIRENKDQPFIAYVSYLEPHPPYNSAFDGMYDPNEVDLPPLFHDELPDNVPLKHHGLRTFQREIGRQMPMKDEATWRRLIARYWGACSLVDKSVGKILETLEQNGLMENTVIVFTSDHGDMMGDFRMAQKGVMYESSVRVPLLVKIPGLEPKAYELPFSHIDLVPTLLELLGAEQKPCLDGRSLVQALTTGTEEERDVFIEWNGEEIKKEVMVLTEEKDRERMQRSLQSSARTIVTPDLWKLSLYDSGEHELYDLNKDPGERCNVFFTEEASVIREQLIEKLTEWQKITEDTLAPNLIHT